jgi:hypothetical protein
MFDTYLTIDVPRGGFQEVHELYPLLPEGTVLRHGGNFYVVGSSFVDLDEQPDIDAVAVQYVTAFPRD